MRKNNSLKFLIITVLVFLFAITGITFSYLYYQTDFIKTNKFTTAKLEINLSNENGEINDVVFSSNYFLDSIIPGDKLSFKNIKITNNSDVGVYCLVNLHLEITPQNNNITKIDCWYNLDGTMLNQDIDNNSISATDLSKNQFKTINFDYIFNGSDFDNQFKNATINITIKTCAIQDSLEQNANFESKDIYASYLIVSANS